MKDRNNKAEILRGLSMLTQLGMSIALPPILCIFFGLWLQRKFSLGDWLIPVCLIVGLISGGCSFASFLRTARYKAKKEEQNRETRQDR
ncbi:MAG: AtpZ/AtpI family protein [Acutalibacteraceae bacterium]